MEIAEELNVEPNTVKFALTYYKENNMLNNKQKKC